ncbi:MAG: HsdR family type I site-specific deoxyribonuclease, partial [Methanothrix sp.]
VLRMISDYILFVRRDGELSKAVLRPHQMRAVERILKRARDPERRRGLVWHTQGSGKTYTMIVAARRLIEDPHHQNPTVLMIVDRNELQQQLFQNLESVGFGHVHVAQSKRHLQELLARDTRGLIVSMIHKFDDIPENLNTRRNIFVLVDEAHRSTGGDLGSYLLAALPNATFIGFTGTPIDKTAYGRGTFKTFGTDDPKGYLDKYSIRESIADGTTVKLNYSLAPNDLRVDPDTLEREFLNKKNLEGVSDIEVLNRVLDRAVTLKNMLKSPRRVDEIARYVARDFQERVKPMGYKAFLVAVDREACCLYKEALDRYLPEESSAVIISWLPNDPEHMRRYYISEDEEERIRKAFRKPGENPEILIVTEKLLTGYDAPILYCMYLDKPMRDHVLLQAIARVNRPYEDDNGRRKPAGLVVDFVGIFDKLERALAFDSEDVQGVVHGIDVLQIHFQHLMRDGQARYLNLIKGHAGDKAIEVLLEHFRDPDRRNDYYRFFRELQDVYEILSPDPFLRPFMDDYRTLGGIYMLLRSYDAPPSISRELLHKTEKLVREHTYTGGIKLPEGIYVIDVNELDRIAASRDPDIKKVFNLLMAIRKITEDQSRSKPYLISIAERAMEIASRFEQRQITAQEALQELIEGPIREMQEAEEELRKRNLDQRTFAVFWMLHREGIRDAEIKARTIADALDRYPHWAYSEHQGRELRRLITKILLKYLSVDRVSDAVERLLNVLKRDTS